MDAAIEYIEELGKTFGGNDTTVSRRGNLTRAMAAIRQYEEKLSLEMLKVLNESGAPYTEFVKRNGSASECRHSASIFETLRQRKLQKKCRTLKSESAMVTCTRRV
jgi:hypothetical protein